MVKNAFRCLMQEGKTSPLTPETSIETIVLGLLMTQVSSFPNAKANRRFVIPIPENPPRTILSRSPRQRGNIPLS
jgi:hypothetical protein